jgi:hypothetical protein
MSDESSRNGRCLCGAVRIAAQPKNADVGACHCSRCRNWGGGPLLTVDCGANVRFEGAENISTFASSEWAERGFCRHCGTHLFYLLKPTSTYFVPVGLVGGADWNFDHQIFIDEKPPFYTFANETTNLTGAEVFAQYAAPSSDEHA